MLRVAFSHEESTERLQPLLSLQQSAASENHDKYTPSNFTQTQSQILQDQLKLVAIAIPSLTLVTATLLYTQDAATASCVIYPLFLYIAILSGKFALDTMI